MDYYDEPNGQLTILEPEEPETSGNTLKKQRPAKTVSELAAIPYLYLDLSPDHVNLLGEHYWEIRSPYLEDGTVLNTGPAPREPIRSSLALVLESDPDPKYDLSRTACRGILRRAEERDRELPPQLKWALTIQARLDTPDSFPAEPGNEMSGERDTGTAAIAFAANQRDEVRDLHGVAGALGAQPGMKQQTLIAGFSAGAGGKAGSIGYSESIAPTLKGTASGNCMPSVLCLNDQGGKIMECSEDVSGTLRAQEHGHQPLVFDNHGQDIRFKGPVKMAQTVSASFGEGGNNQPLIYENHGIDARYTGPHPVAPTLSARAGTGGNNLPLVEQEPPEAICIMGNAIDRQPHNGGNGIGYQSDTAYTLTATDHHAVFSRQRVDIFLENDVVSTESARQYKDATDLICRPVTSGAPRLIRRLTPLECERLQGFPDGWTAIPGASDSSRYKALGNSVAIPCVEFIMAGIVLALKAEGK